jgi:hypothetical protein
MSRVTNLFAKRVKAPPLPDPLLHFVEEEKSRSVLSSFALIQWQCAPALSPSDEEREIFLTPPGNSINGEFRDRGSILSPRPPVRCYLINEAFPSAESI